MPQAVKTFQKKNISDKGLVFRIYKIFLQLNNLKKDKQM